LGPWGLGHEDELYVGCTLMWQISVFCHNRIPPISQGMAVHRGKSVLS
jgi:hypothetical protein